MRDRDTGGDGQRFHLIAWSIVAGVAGGAVGSMVGRMTGGSGADVLIGAMIGGIGVYVAGGAISAGSARVAGAFLAPSGRTTPGAPEFSLAESLAARGMISESVAEYRRHAAERPADPAPCVRLARLHRDHLSDGEAAARWLVEARKRSADGAPELLVVNELVELYERRMKQPERALPELARFAHKHAGTPAGDRAGKELARIRRQLMASGPLGYRHDA